MKHKTLIENTFPLPLVLGYETSKPVPIAIATLLQRERVLTFRSSLLKAMGTGFGDGNGFYVSWLYSKRNGKVF